MRLSKGERYLLDVNVLIALTSKTHIHHQLIQNWFNSSASLPWSVCAFTEAGFLRTTTAPRPGQLSMIEATIALGQLTRHPGYEYQAITADWQTLCSPFFKRLYGTKQVTDAYLLGLAVREGLVLVTMDKGIFHLAGPEFVKHILLLQE